MRKLLLSFIAAFSAFSASSQMMVATFDSLYLSGSDTFYVNYLNAGNDVGFDNGGIHFPVVYDTLFGLNFWSKGFAYSNMSDTTTSGYSNQYSAKPGAGFNDSGKYVVAYGDVNYVYYKQPGPAKSIKGFYVTNSTYAYNSMRDGDAFAKKFGGATGVDQDWFKLSIVRIVNDLPQNDSVHFYLADFRNANSANDYIIKDWQWVDLSSMADADTLMFILSSSDTGSFGMNTPAYFCMDNFTTQYTMSVSNTEARAMARVFPNPATSSLFVEVTEKAFTKLTVLDISGRLLGSYPVSGEQTAIPTEHLLPGAYLLQLSNGNNKASVRFIKQ